MQLDKYQQQIVDSDADKICVIAGAGAGKTAVLSERVRRILENGANPHNIVCITFTNMAAQEMRERLNDLSQSKDMFIGTIHSYAYKLLAATGKAVEILTPQKERELVLELIVKYGKYMTEELYDKWCEVKHLQELGYKTIAEVNAVLTSEAQKELNALIDAPDMKHFYERTSAENAQIVKEALKNQLEAHTSSEYPETVRSLAVKRGFITFDQLLVMAKLNSLNIEYLFVDEFQDVGAFEYNFLKALDAQNVFVVGDDYQCQPYYTKVIKSNGESCNISEIKPGDDVLTYNSHLSKIESAKVLNISESSCTQLIEVRSKSGHVSMYTPNHRCIIKMPSGEDAVVRADMLRISDALITYDGSGSALRTSQISSIKYVHNPEPSTVYSIEVAGNHTYIADRVVTHNSIYGFKGADFEYFKKISRSSKFKTFKLANNYRSNSNIVKYSNSIISQIDTVIPKKCVSKVDNPLPGKIIEENGGIGVIRKYVSSINEKQYGKWFIITRSNNDLVRISRMLYAMGIPCDTFKVGKISREERQLLMTKNSIKVLTVHTAKGLEADNVIAYGAFPSPKSEDSKKFWDTQGDEECRIFYVAATRAKRNLIVVNKLREEEDV